MNLKEQIELQKMYNAQALKGKNDIEVRDEQIDALQNKLRLATQKDIIVKGGKK